MPLPHPTICRDCIGAAVASAERDPVPTELRKNMSDVEREAFFVAQRDWNEQKIAASRGGQGVSWSAMTMGSDYCPKTEEQIWAEAEANVAKRLRVA